MSVCLCVYVCVWGVCLPVCASVEARGVLQCLALSLSTLCFEAGFLNPVNQELTTGLR